MESSGLQESLAVYMSLNGWKSPYGQHAVRPFCLHGLLAVCTPAAFIGKPRGDPYTYGSVIGVMAVFVFVRLCGGVTGMLSLQLEQQHWLKAAKP